MPAHDFMSIRVLTYHSCCHGDKWSTLCTQQLVIKCMFYHKKISKIYDSILIFSTLLIVLRMVNLVEYRNTNVDFKSQQKGPPSSLVISEYVKIYSKAMPGSFILLCSKRKTLRDNTKSWHSNQPLQTTRWSFCLSLAQLFGFFFSFVYPTA